MKIIKKIVFTLLAIITMVGLTYAASTYLINEEGTLKNTVNGTSTSRNTKKGTATFGTGVEAVMLNVANVTGTNASGGIRVKTIAKKITLGVVINEKYLYIPVYPTTTTSSGALFTYNTSKNKVKIQWENWTGNTSFYAEFKAKNKQ